MTRTQKFSGRTTALLVLLAFCALTGLMLHRLGTMGYFSKGGSIPVYGEVPDFSLTEKNGNLVSAKDLAGRVWVADFIFTRCPGPCPLMSLKAKALLKEFPGLTVVSFTSDPDYDVPAVLQKYAASYEADPKRWLFLTGLKETVNQVTEGLKFGKMDEPSMHSTRFVLVDRKNQVRGYYESTDPDGIARLKKDLRTLL